MQYLLSLSGWQQALIATTFTWLMTAAGAALVFFVKKVNVTTFSFMMSAAAGIMLASAFFSLLLPALETGGDYAFLTLSSGFVAGGVLIVLTDIVVKKLNVFSGENARSGAITCAAVTIHNIPEGMAVGVAFAAASGGGIVPAIMLALGIGVQNFPEGMCISFPLRARGFSRFKSFFIGQLSGAVEIISGVAGVLAVTVISGILPVALAFSAGAMIAVVCSELIPQSFSGGKISATVGVIAGFTLMMILDIALG